MLENNKILERVDVHAISTTDKTCLLKNMYKFTPQHNNPWEYYEEPLKDAIDRGYEFKYLYFTISLDITKTPAVGTWVINKNGDTLYQIKDNTFSTSAWKYWNEVIASNNPKLWYKNENQKMGKPDLVHRLPLKFPEAFAKEAGIWEVMLEKYPLTETICPPELRGTYKLNAHGAVTVHKVKEKVYTRKEFEKACYQAMSYGWSNRPDGSFHPMTHCDIWLNEVYPNNIQ
jgi:hypothetical protein